MIRTIIEAKTDLSEIISQKTCNLIKLRNNYYLLPPNQTLRCELQLLKLLKDNQINIRIIGENRPEQTLIKIFQEKNMGLTITETHIQEHYRIGNAHCYYIEFKYIDWNCYIQKNDITLVLTPSSHDYKFGYYSLETVIKMYENLTGNKIIKTPKEKHILDLITKDHNTLTKQTLTIPKQTTITNWHTIQHKKKLKIDTTTLNYTPKELTKSKYKRQIYALLSHYYNNLNPKTSLVNIPKEEERFRKHLEKDAKLITKTFTNNLLELLTGTLTQFDNTILQLNFSEISILTLKIKTQLYPVITGLKYKDGYFLLGWPMNFIKTPKNKNEIQEALKQVEISWDLNKVHKAYIDELYKLTNGKLRILIPQHKFNCENMMEKRFNCILNEIVKNKLPEYPILKFSDDYVIYGVFMHPRNIKPILKEYIIQWTVSLNNKPIYYHNRGGVYKLKE